MVSRSAMGQAQISAASCSRRSACARASISRPRSLLAAPTAMPATSRRRLSLARVVDDLVGALARLTDDGVRLLAGLGQLFLAFLGGRQALRNLALALVHGLQDRWPDPLHRDQDECREDDHLHDQREIDIHGAYLRSTERAVAVSAPLVLHPGRDSRR